MSFQTLVEEIQKLSLGEIEELQFLTRQYFIEKKRDLLLKEHRDSMREYKNNELKFHSSTDTLKRELGYD